MKILYSWLRDYVDIDLPVEKLAQTLSDLGFPAEGIEYLDDDTVIDIEVTSNRGDCLGYMGIAREISAVTAKELKIPKVALNESDSKVESFAAVEVHEPDLCNRYTARIIEGVQVGPRKHRHYMVRPKRDIDALCLCIRQHGTRGTW